MKFIPSSSWKDAAAALAERLTSELSSGHNVLWLVSGGSNLSASVQVMSEIPAALSSQLSVMPVDERYGPPGHQDSNWQQLMSAGFESKQASLLPVLKADLDFVENTDYYNSLAEGAFNDHEVVIGQLGMGADGHIAGILPDSVAAQESASMVVGYDAAPYKRMTLSFLALQKLTAAYVLVYGANKQHQLEKLRNESLTAVNQPAQILKSLKEVYIYSDQVGVQA